jgi:hypothetical protein
MLGTIISMTQEVQRGVTMGKELDCLTRGLGNKMRIHLTEGKRRPEAPMQAEENKDQIKNYIGKLAVSLTI